MQTLFIHLSRHELTTLWICNILEHGEQVVTDQTLTTSEKSQTSFDQQTLIFRNGIILFPVLYIFDHWNLFWCPVVVLAKLVQIPSPFVCVWQDLIDSCCVLSKYFVCHMCVYLVYIIPDQTGNLNNFPTIIDSARCARVLLETRSRPTPHYHQSMLV